MSECLFLVPAHPDRPSGTGPLNELLLLLLYQSAV